MLTEYRKLLTPNKVHIPLADSTYKIAESIVKVGEKVFLGQVVAYKELDNDKVPVLSTVSGEVVAFEERLDRYNKVVDHVVIKNDYKETIETTEVFEGDVPTGIIRKVLKNKGIRRLDVDSIYTAIELDSRVKHVYVSAICQNEPFISTDYRFILDYYKEITDGVLLLGKGANTTSIHVLHDKFMPNEALTLLKDELLDKGVKFISIDSKKVKGFNYLTIAKGIKGKLKTNLLDSGVLYVSIESAKIVSECLRKGIGPIETHVTVTGEGLNNNSEYIVKVGTLFEDIVEDLKGYHNVEELNVHVGNYLSGKQLNDDSFSVTETVNSVNVSEYHQQSEDVCIKCGECNDVCPAGILPQNIMDAELREVGSRIFDLHTDECIECGLCTYVCPSKINVLEWVRRAMRRTV